MDESDFYRSLGFVIKQFRSNEGLTQQQLEEKTGIQRGFISDVECGRKGITIYKLYQLCQGFQHVSTSDLVGMLDRRIAENANHRR
ncbi:MAG: helix-turn-helix domain-containing protein [Candidatus Thiodiazotropha endolucinida]|nr:helix-turn-helix domain-containing protein [Candidatus Thiodiazotropha endolucinida]